jgi:hypothetical protein
VSEKCEQPQPKPRDKAAGSAPEKIVIVGGGAVGFAAAEMLRPEHYQASIVMLRGDGQHTSINNALTILGAWRCDHSSGVRASMLLDHLHNCSSVAVPRS